jgi:hypothetical protein
MTTRERIDRELDHLQSMLPAWREKLREEAQFWPQFDALAARILDSADDADRAFVRQRVERMLEQESLVRPPDKDLQRRPGP